MDLFYIASDKWFCIQAQGFSIFNPVAEMLINFFVSFSVFANFHNDVEKWVQMTRS